MLAIHEPDELTHEIDQAAHAVEPSPLLVDARRLGVMLSAGTRTIRTWDAAGKLPEPVRLGGKVLWRVDEIERWIAAGTPSRADWTVMNRRK